MDREASDRPDGPVTVDLLADLQAGLLDDQTAARLRQRARTEPDIAGRLAALDRVRRDVAALGVDSASAPPIPAEVTAQVGAALRSEPAVTPRRPSGSRLALGAGVAAFIAAAAVGTAMLMVDGSTGGGAPGTAPAAVASPSVGLSLSNDQIDAYLRQSPDLGELTNPQRRASCLSGLGYPTSTSVLGGGRFVVDGRPGVLMLLPGDGPSRLDAVVVAPECSALDSGLLVGKIVSRP